MTRSTVHVSTASYQASHGREPRGTGSWAFFFDGSSDVADAYWADGSYSAARRAAVAEAARRGAGRVEVGS